MSFYNADQCLNQLISGAASISVSSSPVVPTAATVGNTTGNAEGTSAVKPANANTRGWVLKNVSAQNGGTAADAWVSPVSGVTSSNGFYMGPGDVLTGKSPGAIYGTPAVAFAWFEEA